MYIRSIAHMFAFVNRIMLDCVLFIIGLLQIVVHVMQVLFGCLGGFLFVYTYSDTLLASLLLIEIVYNR